MTHKEQIINDARSWLIACCSNEDHEQRINSMSDEEIILAIDKAYDGGIIAFKSLYYVDEILNQFKNL